MPFRPPMLPVYKSQRENPETSQIVSNGPFTLAESKFNDKLVLQRNRFYQEAERVQIDEIQMNFRAISFRCSGMLVEIESP